jgi:hypothetical protein
MQCPAGLALIDDDAVFVSIDSIFCGMICSELPRLLRLHDPVILVERSGGGRLAGEKPTYRPLYEICNRHQLSEG